MTKNPAIDKGKTSDWVADHALRSLIKSVMRLPYERRVATMGRFLQNGVGPLFGYRSRAENNLALIYPDWTQNHRREIANGVCNNFGRTLIENYSHKEFGDYIKHSSIVGTGFEALQNAQSSGQPVIFVTGHFGNHEAPRQVLSQKGLTIGGLYRKMANPYFNDHYAKTMTSWGGPVFEQGRRGTMGFARHIKSGGMGTLLFDVNQDDGEPVQFLGRPALTSTSAAEIALKFDALVIPYFGVRQPNGLSFQIEVDAPIAPTDPIQMTLDMNRALEIRIKENPEQWFWVHRRWKNKAGRL